MVLEKIKNYHTLSYAKKIFRELIILLDKENKHHSTTKKERFVEMFNYEVYDEESRIIYKNELNEFKEKLREEYPERFNLVKKLDSKFGTEFSNKFGGIENAALNLYKNNVFTLEEAIEGYKYVRDIENLEENKLSIASLPNVYVSKTFFIKLDFKDWYNEEEEKKKEEISNLIQYKNGIEEPLFVEGVELYDSHRINLSRAKAETSEYYDKMKEFLQK